MSPLSVTWPLQLGVLTGVFLYFSSHFGRSYSKQSWFVRPQQVSRNPAAQAPAQSRGSEGRRSVLPLRQRQFSYRRTPPPSPPSPFHPGCQAHWWVVPTHPQHSVDSTRMSVILRFCMETLNSVVQGIHRGLVDGATGSPGYLSVCADTLIWLSVPSICSQECRGGCHYLSM